MYLIDKNKLFQLFPRVIVSCYDQADFLKYKPIYCTANFSAVSTLLLNRTIRHRNTKFKL